MDDTKIMIATLVLFLIFGIGLPLFMRRQKRADTKTDATGSDTAPPAESTDETTPPAPGGTRRARGSRA